MRKLGLPWLVISIAILGLALGGCSGKDGERGPAGINGTNGQDGQPGQPGQDGTDGTATCMNCHTDEWDAAVFLLPLETEFAVSQHNTGDTFLRRGSTSGPDCSGCHTNEGYQVYVTTGTTQAIASSSRISCFTCHAPHTRQDFTLRKTGATTLNQGGTYNKGESNTCAMCHQARNPSPDFNATAPITSSRWGPHHGAQSNVLAGAGAYAFPGVTYDGGHMHNTGIADGCLTCHMGSIATDNLAGGHTFRVVYPTSSGDRLNSKACVACHSAWTDATGITAVVTAQTAFEEKLHEIRTILVAKGWMNDATGLLNASSSAPLALTADERGAIWNYYMFEEDRSLSVHNPRYANAVIDATKTFLEAKSL